MGAAFGEGETGAGDEVSDRARDEHLAGLGLRHHPGTGVDRDAAHLLSGPLAFAGVDAGPHLETQPPDRLANTLGAANRTGRAIERGEETIARGVLLHTTVTSKLVAHEPMMVAEQLLPVAVAEIHGALGRTHAAYPSISQCISTFEIQPGTTIRSSGPSPITW
jgi:hypothetical protein